MGKFSRGKIKQENGDLHYFSVRDCKVCKKCIGNGERQRVWVSDAEKERLKTGKAVTRGVGKNIRFRMEGKYGEGKCWDGLGKARWRGRVKVAIQGFLTFSVLNVKRLAKLLCPS